MKICKSGETWKRITDGDEGMKRDLWVECKEREGSCN